MIRRLSIQLLLPLLLVNCVCSNKTTGSTNCVRSEIFSMAKDWENNRPFLLELLDHPIAECRVFAIQAMPLVVQTEDADKVANLLNDADREVRVAALNRFLDWNTEEALHSIVNLSKSTFPEERRLAIMALGHQCDMKAVGALEAILESDSKHEYTKVARESLKVLRTCNDKNIKAKANELLAKTTPERT